MCSSDLYYPGTIHSLCAEVTTFTHFSVSLAINLCVPFGPGSRRVPRPESLADYTAVITR